MSSSSNKVPRIELTRERSSTLESIQSLTRAIRESLRIHNVRREKRRAKKKRQHNANFLDVNDSSRRLRSKSMDENTVEKEGDSYNEISDIGISSVVASDFGPTIDTHALVENLKRQNMETMSPRESDEVFTDCPADESQATKELEILATRERRLSKSVDEAEMNQLRKGSTPLERKSVHPPKPLQMSLDLETPEKSCGGKGAGPARQSSVPSGSTRRPSKDDSDVPKVDANVLRKRFARLIDTLRSHKFSLSSLEENNNNNNNNNSDSKKETRLSS